MGLDFLSALDSNNSAEYVSERALLHGEARSISSERREIYGRLVYLCSVVGVS